MLIEYSPWDDCVRMLAIRINGESQLRILPERYMYLLLCATCWYSTGFLLYDTKHNVLRTVACDVDE
jgi:hypothetical protein